MPRFFRTSRRVLALAAVLLAGAGWLVATQAPSWCLARWRAALAQQDWVAAEAWLARAQRCSRPTAELEFAAARQARKLSRPEEMLAHLRRAAELGAPRERLEREQWLALAASGRVEELERRLPDLFVRGDDLPEICEAYVLGCIVNYQLGEAQRVLQLWEADFPDDPQPRFLQGRLLEHRSDLKAAAAQFREALKRAPRHAAAAYNLGRILLDQQQPQEALEAYRRAAAALPEPQPALVGEARALRDLGRLAEARQAIQAAVARPPDRLEEAYRLVGEPAESAYSQAPAEFGQLELAEEHWQAAVEWFEWALAAHARDWRIRHSYATALRQLGRKDEAARETALVEETRQALASCDRLIDQLRGNPADPDARYRVGTVLLKYHSENQGLIWLHSVLAYDPHHQATHQALAEYYEAHAAEHPEFAERAARHRREAAAPPR